MTRLFRRPTSVGPGGNPMPLPFQVPPCPPVHRLPFPDLQGVAISAAIGVVSLGFAAGPLHLRPGSPWGVML